MSLIQYNPYHSPIRSTHMNQFLSGLLPGFEKEQTIAASDWTPTVDIKEDAERYLISADVPGINLQDIEVSLENDILTIKGERKFDREENANRYRRVERSHGTFLRRFSLPDTANQDKVKASCKDGVLVIAIEKQDKAQPRKITISN